MAGKNVMVTGASGFIGTRLVERLLARGDNVTCLARHTSDISNLEKMNCSIVFGDTIKDHDAVVSAVRNKDVVYHLAAATNAIRSRDLVTMNTAGLENVLKGCAACQSPPTLVFVSSLAAVGPSPSGQPKLEQDPRNPVSNYGRSKEACERLATEYSSQIPISIVRPPIVLGGGDRQGLEMFHMIDRWGWHLVPGFKVHSFSVIHVDDLITALMNVAESGKRVCEESPADGIYFASADETVSYAELGRLIGKSLGREKTRVLPVLAYLVWLIAAVNELIARLLSKPQYLNLDKCREATTGSWVCSNAKIKQEVGFALSTPLVERLQQTVEWYRRHGWLSRKEIAPAGNAPEQASSVR